MELGCVLSVETQDEASVLAMNKEAPPRELMSACQSTLELLWLNKMKTILR